MVNKIANVKVIINVMFKVMGNARINSVKMRGKI